MTSQVELQQLRLPSVTRSAKIVGPEHRLFALQEQNRALFTSSLAGQDTSLIIVRFQLTLSQHSSSKSGNTRELIASLLNSYQKKGQTVGGHQQQHQSILLVILRQHSLQPPSKIQSQIKFQNSICPELIIHAGAALKSWIAGFLSFCLRHIITPKV